MTSNIVESLSATNIVSHANRDRARATKTDMSRTTEEMLNENYIQSLHLTVSPANDNIYTITKTITPFSVNLEKGTYCCNKVQIDKIPCAHVVAVIRKCNKNPLLYCTKYYMTETYINTYNHTVYYMTNK
ncbi:uncharacterized protein LOC126678298 [Mercurialis annua]|uniref:uncharacterized protein LOC126678298 n=1 Tax=Mercurialis annua TaxID=3986 RepID=UPI00215EB2E7|nr:uncharacterized protein LOC126678298 [Mercurialis annua]